MALLIKRLYGKDSAAAEGWLKGHTSLLGKEAVNTTAILSDPIPFVSPMHLPGCFGGAFQPVYWGGYLC